MSSSEETIHSINQLLEVRTSEHPDLEILAVPNTDLSYTRYTYSDISSAAALLANYYTDQRILPPRASGDTASKLTVALLSHSGWDYVVQELALVKMGYCVLFISVNNAPAAISHLLQATGSSHIIVHPHFMVSVEEALSSHPPKQDVKVIPQVEGDLYSPEKLIEGGKNGKTVWTMALKPEEEERLPAFIVHSSGSTGFPKPIILSHIASVRNFSQHFGLRGFTTLPLYHNHGHSCFYRAIHGAARIYLFPQSVIPLTTANVCGLLTANDCDAEALFGVPYVLKILAEDTKGLEVLKGFKLVMYGGSACPDELGDRLVEEGVNLVGHYGLTEMGQIFTSFRDFKVDKGWNWLRGSGPYAKKGLMNWIKFEHHEEDKFELVVLDGYPTKVLSNRPDGSYSTKDLFIMHPTVPDAFKFVGRIDDTLVMVNGEKTNPVPMELTLRQSPFISEAVIFGSGRSQTGALIIVGEGIDASLPVDRLVEIVKPSVALANLKAPTHSQLAPEALVFLPYGTQLPKADKGSFLRPKVYAMFKDIIDKVYRVLEGEDGAASAKESLRDVEHAKAVVHAAVVKAVDKNSDALTGDTDLFAFGLDSLQATRIRNTIQRELDLKGKKLPTNFVFEHPSRDRMAIYLLSLVNDAVQVAAPPNETELMLAMVKKYSRELLTKPDGLVTNGVPETAVNGSIGEHVVVLTGATGSLGASLLECLLLDNSVSIVYALSRAADDNDARRRVMDSMKERGLYTEFDKARLVCLATSDFGAPYLGIAKPVYDEIATTVTHVIHNAWPVNFNWTITSFEPHVCGAVNLIKLGQARHAKFFFSSSISAVFHWPGPGPVPEAVIEDPKVAQHMGYAQSKWTVEKLCEIASERAGAQASVLRIGQMVGDSRTGVWNETEAVSLIIKSAEVIKVLPDLDESVSWLPVDYAARCITELAFGPSGVDDKTLCWHVVQPRLVHWSGILQSLKKSGLVFDIVPQRVWLDRLRTSDPDPVANPTIKLLSFYEGKYGGDPKGRPARYPLETRRTEAASESLRTAPEPDDALVGKWVGAWRKKGFLH